MNSMKKRIEAYKFLEEQCPTLGRNKKTRDVSKIEDIFYYGVPINRDTYDKCVENIIHRIEKAQNNLKGSQISTKDQLELQSIAILAASVFIYSLDYDIPKDKRDYLANYLSKIFQRKKGLVNLIRRVNNFRVHSEDLILILHSDLIMIGRYDFYRSQLKKNNKKLGPNFENVIEDATSAANTIRSLYYYLYNIYHWRLQKDRKITSLDAEIKSTSHDQKGVILFRDTLEDTSSKNFFDECEEKMKLEKVNEIIETLPPKMKEALKKYKEGKPITPTETRAKNRGIKKLKELIDPEIY